MFFYIEKSGVYGFCVNIAFFVGGNYWRGGGIVGGIAGTVLVIQPHIILFTLNLSILLLLAFQGYQSLGLIQNKNLTMTHLNFQYQPHHTLRPLQLWGD
jgi:hypothetical protein